MLNQSSMDETRRQLDNLLKKWSNRWRLRQIVLYLPRIIIAMCLIAMLVAVIITLLNLLTATPMLIVSGIAMSLTFMLITGTIGLWRKNTQEVARQFDALFDSRERLATAFELLDGRIQTGQEIAERQLQDTYEFAKVIDSRKKIPFEANWLEWISSVVVVIITIGVLLFSAYILTTRANTIGEATIAATNDAADLTRDITGEIATDTNLTDDERSSLLESAEMALSELENPDTNAEDAFVAMSEFESDLRDQSDSIGDSAESSNESLSSAMESLSGEPQGNAENPGESLSDELSDLADEFDTLSEEEQEALQQALQEAIDALQEENEALANALQEALDAMQSNQSQQAQDALNQASEQAQSASQENQARSETSEALQEAADEARQAAQEIAESEQQDAQSQQEAQEGDQAQDGQEAQPGSDTDRSVQSQEVQESQPGEDGDPGQNGDPGEQGQEQSAEQGQPGESEEGDSSSESSEQGGEAGDSSSESSSLEVSGSDTGSSESNTANDGGETDYEPVFAPPLFNNRPGNTNVELETDDTNASTIEGEFQENPDGESTVPYNEVFSTYSDAANSALENGYVPLGVRDIVRDYFTSIEPTDR